MVNETIFDVIERADRDAVGRILASGAALGVAGKDERLPLHAAAVKSDLDIARMLLNAGADVDGKTNWQQTPLYFSASLLDLPMCGLLIENGADVNWRDWMNGTALNAAAVAALAGRDVRDVCAFLLDHGADPNVCSGATEKAALHYAIEGYHESKGTFAKADSHWYAKPEVGLDLINLLVSRGADLSFVPENAAGSYLTPFQMAIKLGELDLVRQFVLENGEDPAQRMVVGRTMAQVAGKNAEMKMLLQMLKTEAAVGAAFAEAAEPSTESTRRPSVKLSL